jgi:hypothetical protein
MVPGFVKHFVVVGSPLVTVVGLLALIGSSYWVERFGFDPCRCVAC